MNFSIYVTFCVFFIAISSIKSNPDFCEKQIKVDTLIRTFSRKGQSNAKQIFQDYQAIVANVFKNSFQQVISNNDTSYNQLITNDNFNQLVTMVSNPDSYSNDLCKLQTSLKDNVPADMISKLAYVDFLKSVTDAAKPELKNAGEALKKKDGGLIFRLRRSESSNKFNAYMDLLKEN